MTYPHRGLNFEDKSVALLAARLDAGVLSGDGLLKKYCQQLQLEVKGIIWLFDAFLEKKLFGYDIAIQKLEELLVFNTRLPKAACEARLKGWKTKL